MARTVIALYDDFSSANDAIRDLVNNGFNRSDISIMASDQSGEYSRYLQHSGDATRAPESGAATGAGVGAGIGAVVGGLAGILIGLGALAIPGIGPVLAAGPLAAALTGLAGAGAGAVAGGVTGGLIGALSDMGIPKENAGYFAEGVRRGGTLVVARTSDEMAGTARDILNRHNPVDMNERVSQWRQSGWTGYQENEGAGLTSRGTDMGANMDQSRREEYANTESNSGIPPTGGQYGSTSTPQEWNRETYQQTHEGVDSGANTRGMDQGRTEWNQPNPQGADTSMGDSGTNQDQNQADWHDVNQNTDMGTANRYDQTQSTSQTNQPMDTSTSPSYQYREYTTYQDTFRDNFNHSAYATSYSYDQYEPAYRYGYDLATNSRYRNRDWNDIQSEAQGYWDERNPGTWDRIKDAVHYAWDQVKGTVS